MIESLIIYLVLGSVAGVVAGLLVLGRSVDRTGSHL